MLGVLLILFILWHRRLELGEVTREMTAADDFLGSVRDPNVKEIIAKASIN